MRLAPGLLLVAACLTAGVVPAGAAGYQRGAFYYGSGCGGNPVAGMAAVSPASKTRGVILGDGSDDLIGGQMNCDDRRHAIGSYRDGLEGQLGQTQVWLNHDGGSTGSFTPVRSFSRDGNVCRDFREVYSTDDTHIARNNGTACLQSDGNWHTL